MSLTRFLRAAFLSPVRLYRRVLSPMLPPRCRYHPSCSAYAVDAVDRYGILRGGVLAAWRVARCNPWSLGGHDPVEAQRLFAAPRPTH
jgi:putative membrane protein insertion efficiency factor